MSTTPFSLSFLALGLSLMGACGGGENLGGSFSATVSDSGDANVSWSSFAGTTTGGRTHDHDSLADGFARIYSTQDNGEGNCPHLEVQWPAPPEAGTTFSMETPLADGGARVFVEEGLACPTQFGTTRKDWISTAGTLSVDSVSGTAISVVFSDVFMEPAGDNESTGTFTLSGTATSENFDVGIDD